MEANVTIFPMSVTSPISNSCVERVMPYMTLLLGGGSVCGLGGILESALVMRVETS